VSAIWRFVRRDDVQVGAIAALFLTMWGVLFAAAWNDQKALEERANKCAPDSATATQESK
jgi:hypothetical protein